MRGVLLGQYGRIVMYFASGVIGVYTELTHSTPGFVGGKKRAEERSNVDNIEEYVEKKFGNDQQAYSDGSNATFAHGKGLFCDVQNSHSDPQRLKKIELGIRHERNSKGEEIKRKEKNPKERKKESQNIGR